MMESGRIFHSTDFPPRVDYELIAKTSRKPLDQLLQNLVELWKRTANDKRALKTNKGIGVGFAYSIAINKLYCTAWLTSNV